MCINSLLKSRKFGFNYGEYYVFQLSAISFQQAKTRLIAEC